MHILCLLQKDSSLREEMDKNGLVFFSGRLQTNQCWCVLLVHTHTFTKETKAIGRSLRADWSLVTVTKYLLFLHLSLKIWLEQNKSPAGLHHSCSFTALLIFHQHREEEGLSSVREGSVPYLAMWPSG